MPTGKVKMFNEDRGFGFIKPDAMEALTFSFTSPRCAKAMKLRGISPSALKWGPTLSPEKRKPSVSI
jgi:hypothetical protein